jgi:Xaa-Pro aminopeptidase
MLVHCNAGCARLACRDACETCGPRQRWCLRRRRGVACVQVKPGAQLRDIHALSVALLSEALADLGVSRGGVGGGYRRFYPHSVGHWLGLDTHDCASISHDTPLEPGVALTIEPGLYLQGEGVPPEFQGIGVRIEDDVVMAAGGARVLSAGVPTAAAELEALAGSAA